MYVILITAVLHSHIYSTTYSNDIDGPYRSAERCNTDLLLWLTQAKVKKGVHVYLSCEPVERDTVYVARDQERK